MRTLGPCVALAELSQRVEAWDGDGTIAIPVGVSSVYGPLIELIAVRVEWKE